MTLLTKTRRIYTLGYSPRLNADSPAIFHFHCDETTPHADSTLVIEPDVWEDMGRPGTITVTVEPGDMLNNEEASGGAE